jgi:predicted nuclease of predicted toxin-antitoxin system
MRILLDECVNQRLRHYFAGHEGESAEYAGFSGLKNGELLDAAESDFDVLLTVDRGLQFEQNLVGRPGQRS